MDADPRGTLLFHRDYHGFSGGHLKVWHYVCHAEASCRFRPAVHLAPEGDHGPGNPFRSRPDLLVHRWDPASAAALFVAGLDWERVPPDLDVPVVNLVQGMRHADPGDRRGAFLRRRALRICISEEAADAIRATGLVNGPVVTIPNGVDIAVRPRPPGPRGTRLLVAGWKEPEWTRTVATALRGLGEDPVVIDAAVDRETFLARLGDADTTVLLPLPREGCFLPALEAFALGSLVVCPDCVGNRGFCRDGDTCLVPERRADAIAHAAVAALVLPPERRTALLERAAAEVRARGLEAERCRFLALLDDLPGAW